MWFRPLARRVSIVPLVALAALVSSSSDAAGRSTRAARSPNIVLIIGDDHGWPYSGFMGDAVVETPNLDRLAEEGTVFTHGYAPDSVCRPALATLLTGLLPSVWDEHRRRLVSLYGHPIPSREAITHYQTLPRQLARRGYRSFQGGKHWEGSFEMAGFSAGTAASVGTGLQIPGSSEFGRPSLEPLADFLDDVGDTPFFLWLAPQLPHVPLDPPAELRAIYEGRGFSASAVLYYANVTRLDRFVGDVLDDLDRRGLRDETLVIYLSDNGWDQSPHDAHPLAGSGGPKGKGSVNELGFRTPIIFNWPNRVPAGRRDDALVTFMDVHATVLDFAGAPAPPDPAAASLKRRIEGFGGAVREAVFSVQQPLRYDVRAFVRTEAWRYLVYPVLGIERLYRIEEDPFEVEDLSAAFPEVASALRDRALRWHDALFHPLRWMSVSGTVRAPDGSPAANLALQLRGKDANGAPRGHVVMTDAGGRFRIPNVQAGAYALQVGTSDFVFDGRPYTSLPLDLRSEVASTYLELDLAAGDEARASGHDQRGDIAISVRDEAGDGAPGVPILLTGFTRSGIVHLEYSSGPDGAVVADRIPAGIYIVRPREAAEGRSWRWSRSRSRLIYLDSSRREDVALGVSSARTAVERRHVPRPVESFTPPSVEVVG